MSVFVALDNTVFCSDICPSKAGGVKMERRNREAKKYKTHLRAEKMIIVGEVRS